MSSLVIGRLKKYWIYYQQKEVTELRDCSFIIHKWAERIWEKAQREQRNKLEGLKMNTGQKEYKDCIQEVRE